MNRDRTAGKENAEQEKILEVVEMAPAKKPDDEEKRRRRRMRRVRIQSLNKEQRPPI